VKDVVCRPLAEVRRVIASHLVRDRASIPETLGHITLRQAQRDVAARLAALISIHGGAMLAEPVGLGKTYAALAVARAFDGPLVIAVPAALREMWMGALADARVSATIISHEALSRGVAPTIQPGLVIVDEAHRFRSRNTRRYASLATLCARARVLLVTATPVHNRRNDLAAQLALFRGRGAWQIGDGELGEYVVRESSSSVAGQPALSGPHAIHVARDDDCLDALLAVPPPIPAKDESLAHGLMTFGLVHQWSSSRAALAASLERRRARGIALLAAIESGRHPTKHELSAWRFTGDSLQLAFPELVTNAPNADGQSPARLANSLREHDEAVATLLRHIRADVDCDAARANALREILRNHPGERVIAFSHYTETVNALRRLLATEPGIAALTARGAHVAGGRISRADVLSQFTPGVCAAATPARDRISLLITTDLLSEGLNLQEASVIVHLDLPWNPARLEQRVGRARRLGSRHEVVTVYAFDPPTSAERLLRIETRLHEKLAIAAAAIGRSPPVLPSLSSTRSATPGNAELASEIVMALRGWLASDATAAELSRSPTQMNALRPPIVAAVESDSDGFVALVIEASRPRLVAGTDASVHLDTSLNTLYRAVNNCTCRETQVDDARLTTVLARLHTWSISRRGALSATVQGAPTTPARRAALRRIAKTINSVPRHQRARLASLAALARHALTGHLAEGAERLLDELVASAETSERWLQSIANLGELYTRQTHSQIAAQDGEVVAIVLFTTTSSQSMRPAP
jgi:superfamily II DNA or RNA helicase